MSFYCDDCIHAKVCKYVKEMREFESKKTVYSAGIGPTVSYSVNCKMKVTERNSFLAVSNR